MTRLLQRSAVNDRLLSPLRGLCARHQGLSVYEHGVYLNLIHWYYLNEGPIPLDWQKLVRNHGSRLQKEHCMNTARCWHTIFTLINDAWHHKRCDHEIANIRKMRLEVAAKTERARRQRTVSRAGAQMPSKPYAWRGCNMPWNATAQTHGDAPTPETARRRSPESKFNPKHIAAAAHARHMKHLTRRRINGKLIQGHVSDVTTKTPNPINTKPYKYSAIAVTGQATEMPTVCACVSR